MKELKLIFLMLTAVLVCVVSFSDSARAAQEIEIIFDASRSMEETNGATTRLSAAKQALTSIAGQIAPDSRVGLRVFGSTPVRGNIKETCVDSKLLIPIQPFNQGQMTAMVMGLNAYGQTPIGFSLSQAAADFTASQDVQKTVILISDGEESCNVDPEGVIKLLKSQGIDLVVHTVGFDVDEAARGQLKKLSDMTGGTYADASTADELMQGLQTIGEQSLLLVPQKSGKKNLLSAAEGTRIVSSTKPQLAALIDGKEEEIKEPIWAGDSIVFSFKDGQAVLLESFAVPVFQKYNYNPSGFELWGSLTTTDDAAFAPLTKIEVKNEVQFGNVYQEFTLDPAPALKYLKVVFAPGASGSQSYPIELRSHGRYLNDAELAEYMQAADQKEMNLLAAANGGQFIAGARPEFANLIDGSFDNPGDKVSTYGNEEGIFAFRDNKVALIKKVAVPIYQASGYNVKTIEISGSVTSPTSGYEPLGTFETMNMVFAGNPYQEYVFEKPARVKYLKVKLVDAHGGGYAMTHELQAIGTFE